MECVMRTPKVYRPWFDQCERSWMRLVSCTSVYRLREFFRAHFRMVTAGSDDLGHRGVLMNFNRLQGMSTGELGRCTSKEAER